MGGNRERDADLYDFLSIFSWGYGEIIWVLIMANAGMIRGIQVSIQFERRAQEAWELPENNCREFVSIMSASDAILQLHTWP